jgi:hypothetical protein
MDAKTDLLINVKEWLKIDEEISSLQSEVREKKKAKKALSDIILHVMKDNNAGILNCSEGSLKCVQNKVKKPINDKTLDVILKQYFKTNEEAESVKKYILENREVEIKEIVKKQ